MHPKINFDQNNQSSYIQMSLFEENKLHSTIHVEQFSSDSTCYDLKRKKLEEKYQFLFQENHNYDRKAVSFQGNKEKIIHNWFHYKEGFSSDLVASLIQKLNIQSGSTLLEPFCGSGTTLLVAKHLNINALGFEISPLCSLIWNVKSSIDEDKLEDVQYLYNLLEQTEPKFINLTFPHLKITEDAFSEQTENDLMFYTQWIDNIELSESVKTLFKFVLVSLLEEVSYTRKDGQCLRWDYRSAKIQKRNKERLKSGKKLAKKFDKGYLPSVKESSLNRLSKIIKDITLLKYDKTFQNSSQQNLIIESALEALPKLESNQFSGVITSPPYCNRYDYSRIYALELAYLGINEKEIRRLRQTQLSCTVENKSKLDDLFKIYQSLNQEKKFDLILNTITNNETFQEINRALQQRWNRKEINNKGVLTMIERYFLELTFVIAEMYRTCCRNSYVALVNDNVKYGGEIIPVDTLCTEIAESLGFIPIVIYVLPQLKGNSSQQMDKYGRTALRKSITVWQKP